MRPGPSYAVSLFGLLFSAFSQAAPPATLGDRLATEDPAKLKASLAVKIRQIIKNQVAGKQLDRVVPELAVWRLLNQVSEPQMKLVQESSYGKAFLKWLVSQPALLEVYLSSGTPNEYNATGIGAWGKIWGTRIESRTEGVYQRLAVATALTFAVPFGHMADGAPVDPIKRYNYYIEAYKKGLLFPYFEKAAPWELRYVVSSWARDDDMDWVRGKVDPKLKNQESIGDACWMVPYRDTNSKGVSVQEGSKYYDYKPMTLQLMVEVGGVCGAISRFGTSVCQAYGIPAMPLGQPVHCAHVWRNKEGSWKLGQDVSGWPQSWQHDGIRILFGARPSYLVLFDKAVADPLKYMQSQRLMWYSVLEPNPDERIKLLSLSVQAAPANLPAIKELLVCARGIGSREFAAALRVGLPGLKDNPYAVSDLLKEAAGSIWVDSATDPSAREAVATCFESIPSGDPSKQLGCAWWAETELLDSALKAASLTSADFLSCLRSGKDDAGLLKPLAELQKKACVSILVTAIRSSSLRKDVYDAVLKALVAMVQKEPGVAPFAAASLSAIADRAKTDKVQPFASDACKAVASLYEAAKDHAAAAAWQSKAKTN